MASSNVETPTSNIVNFSEVQVNAKGDFEGYTLKNVIYRINTEFSINTEVDGDFIYKHCRLMPEFAEYIDARSRTPFVPLSENIEYTFSKGELYLYVSIQLSGTTDRIDPQILPLTIPVDSIINNEDFIDIIRNQINDQISNSSFITRNQLRIRSNNIQAWVVNNFVAKNAKGDASYIQGQVKVSETDSTFGFLQDKIISADESVDIAPIGSSTQKLNITTKVNGIAFADVFIASTDWEEEIVDNTPTGYYTFDMNCDLIKREIQGTDSDRYMFIKNVDAYLVDNSGGSTEPTFSEFSVEKYYNKRTKRYDVGSTSVVKTYCYVSRIRTNTPHDAFLVLYLTNGTVPKDSGGGGGGGSGEPAEYLAHAVKSQDGKTLTLYPRVNGQSGSPVVFAPPLGATQLSELTDFTSQQGQSDLVMLQSLINITRTNPS